MCLRYSLPFRVHRFTVKYRRALLSEEVVAEITRLSQEIEARYQIEIECLGADRDHIHLVCSAHPKIAPGVIVRIYKSIVARELFKRFPELKKQLWGGEFWTDGYFVATASRRGDWNTLLRYVRNQGQAPDKAGLQMLLPELSPEPASDANPGDDTTDYT